MKWKWILRGHYGLLLGLFACGTALTIAGLMIDKQVMSVIGGALVGGTIGSLISGIEGHEFQDKTLDVIKSTLENHFVSDEQRIKRFRRKWHVYYQTKVDGKYEWRHAVWDMHEQKMLGGLSGTETTYDPTGRPSEYSIEGGLRDHRVVLFTKAAASDEPCAVVVMPFMGESYHSSHYGVQFHRTWDGNDSMSPVIARTTPLDEVKQVGPVRDPAKIAVLVALWRSKFLQLNEVFPNGCSEKAD